MRPEVKMRRRRVYTFSARGSYFKSESTSCWLWLAWARAAMPVCSRMENLVRFAMVCAVSAARILSSAEVRFWVWLLMTFDALGSRLLPAPVWPGCAATVEIGGLLALVGACGS